MNAIILKETRPGRTWLILVVFTLVIALSGCGGTQKTAGNGLTALKAENEHSGEQQNNEQGNYKATFIELGSVRCIPCKLMQPIMKEIETEYSDQVKVIFYDVWTEEGRPYGSKYGITAIPTQVFLDAEGKEYYRHIGFFPKDQLVEILKQQGVQ